MNKRERGLIWKGLFYFQTEFSSKDLIASKIGSVLSVSIVSIVSFYLCPIV